MEENNKYLERKEMEEMLPDYLFGRLSPEDAMHFEDSLHLYPDIQQELTDAREVFEKVNKLDFSSGIESRAKNISYKINEKLGKEKYGTKILGFSPRLIAPVLGLIAVVVVLIITSDNNPFRSQNISQKENSTKFQILTPKDAILIIGTDSSITSDELAELTSSQIYSFRNEIETAINGADNAETAAIFQEIWLESFENLINSSSDNIDNLSGINSDGTDLLEYLDENDFQELIKVIQNEKFPS